MRGIFNLIIYAVFWSMVVVATMGFGLIIVLPMLWLTFAGMDERAEKAAEKLAGTLMAGEVLLASGIQHRAFALRQRRALVAITSSRVVAVRRGVLGGFRMLDIQWKDLRDATIQENVLPGLCGANLRFAHDNGRVAQLDVPGVLSDAAHEIYSRAQSEEQAWEEKRRVRAIEEARAISGGVVVNAGGPANAVPAGNSMIDQINQAKALLDSGAISDAEYNEMKSKILGAV